MSPLKQPSRRQLKRDARAMLVRAEFDSFCDWALDESRAFGIVMTMLFDADELIRWRTIEMMGRVAAGYARRNRKLVREIIRRLLWAMNDESGSVAWNAPEAIAEIVINVSKLEEYAEIMASSIDVEPFERGVHWGIARIAAAASAGSSVNTAWLFDDFTDYLQESFTDADPFIRAHAALALGHLKVDSALEAIETLCSDSTAISVYDFDDHELHPRTVGDMARDAAALLGS